MGTMGRDPHHSSRSWIRDLFVTDLFKIAHGPGVPWVQAEGFIKFMPNARKITTPIEHSKVKVCFGKLRFPAQSERVGLFRAHRVTSFFKGHSVIQPGVCARK